MNQDLRDLIQEYVNDSTLDAPTMQLPSPALRTYYSNEANRYIWVEGMIDFDSSIVFKKILMYNQIDKDVPVEERKPIKIFIDSMGGDEEIMWQILNAIKLSKTPVWTINICEAFSAAGIILMAGHKRFALPATAIVIHKGSCSYSGDADKVEASKKYFDDLAKKTRSFIVNSTKIDEKLLKKKTTTDWWLDTDEALTYGVIDKIIDNLDEIL